MSTKTKQRRKTSAKYGLCCMSVMLFTYPGAPYRVYVADRSSGGLVMGRQEVMGFASRAEAERWLNKNCRSWKLCGSP
jgi:hypothetical protein